MIYDNYLQFYVFIVCFAFGAITGVLYEPISFLKGKYKNFKVWLAPDFLFCALFCFLFLSVAYFFRFPDFRGYMLIGLFSGILAENKSLHYYLQKTYKRCIMNKT